MKLYRELFKKIITVSHLPIIKRVGEKTRISRREPNQVEPGRNETTKRGKNHDIKTLAITLINDRGAETQGQRLMDQKTSMTRIQGSKS